MANRIEVARDYLGSVVQRTFGISAFREAMQRPEIHRSHHNRWPSVDKVLNHRANFCFASELLSPAAYSAQIAPLLRTTAEADPDHIKITRSMIPMMVIDAALLGAAFFLGQDLLGFAAWKLGGNVVIQVGSDLAHRIRGSRPPTATILAV